MPVLWPQPLKQDELRCSFCHKGKSDVARLVSNPSDYPRAYICDECVAICSTIAEEKEDPFLGNPLASEFLAATEQWIMRESTGQDASEQLSRMRNLARLMFPEAAPSKP